MSEPEALDKYPLIKMHIVERLSQLGGNAVGSSINFCVSGYKNAVEEEYRLLGLSVML